MKKFYLKEWLENLLSLVVLLSIGFIAMTIDSLGNTTYNKIFIILLIVNALIVKVLTKFGKTFQI